MASVIEKKVTKSNKKGIIPLLKKINPNLVEILEQITNIAKKDHITDTDISQILNDFTKILHNTTTQSLELKGGNPLPNIDIKYEPSTHRYSQFLGITPSSFFGFICNFDRDDSPYHSLRESMTRVKDKYDVTIHENERTLLNVLSELTFKQKPHERIRNIKKIMKVLDAEGQDRDPQDSRNMINTLAILLCQHELTKQELHNFLNPNPVAQIALAGQAAQIAPVDPIVQADPVEQVDPNAPVAAVAPPLPANPDGSKDIKTKMRITEDDPLFDIKKICSLNMNQHQTEFISIGCKNIYIYNFFDPNNSDRNDEERRMRRNDMFHTMKSFISEADFTTQHDNLMQAGNNTFKSFKQWCERSSNPYNHLKTPLYIGPFTGEIRYYYNSEQLDTIELQELIISNFTNDRSTPNQIVLPNNTCQILKLYFIFKELSYINTNDEDKQYMIIYLYILHGVDNYGYILRLVNVFNALDEFFFNFNTTMANNPITPNLLSSDAQQAFRNCFTSTNIPAFTQNLPQNNKFLNKLNRNCSNYERSIVKFEVGSNDKLFIARIDPWKQEYDNICSNYRLLHFTDEYNNYVIRTKSALKSLLIEISKGNFEVPYAIQGRETDINNLALELDKVITEMQSEAYHSKQPTEREILFGGIICFFFAFVVIAILAYYGTGAFNEFWDDNPNNTTNSTIVDRVTVGIEGAYNATTNFATSAWNLGKETIQYPKHVMFKTFMAGLFGYGLLAYYNSIAEILKTTLYGKVGNLLLGESEPQEVPAEKLQTIQILKMICWIFDVFSNSDDDRDIFFELASYKNGDIFIKSITKNPEENHAYLLTLCRKIVAKKNERAPRGQPEIVFSLEMLDEYDNIDPTTLNCRTRVQNLLGGRTFKKGKHILKKRKSTMKKGGNPNQERKKLFVIIKIINFLSRVIAMNLKELAKNNFENIIPLLYKNIKKLDIPIETIFNTVMNCLHIPDSNNKTNKTSTRKMPQTIEIRTKKLGKIERTRSASLKSRSKSKTKRHSAPI